MLIDEDFQFIWQIAGPIPLMWINGTNLDFILMLYDDFIN